MPALAPKNLGNKAEDLLYSLLWTVDKLVRPTFRNLTDSFEAWAYRKGFHQQLWKLERRQLIERQTSQPRQRLYRLTENGRLYALGGRDPAMQWNRVWDNHWRLVVYDLPEKRNAARNRLRRFLRAHGFGYLQNSVWITPDPLAEIVKQWCKGGKDVESLIALEARPCAGESNAAIVEGAWDFERINRSYAKCLAILRQLPPRKAASSDAKVLLHRWARAERLAWLEAVSLDPLLPSVLLPEGYRGQQVWERRAEALRHAAELIS